MKKLDNKVIAIGTAAALVVGGLVIYNNKGTEYQDGTYRVEADSFDKSGWKPFMEMTFKDGLVTDVVFDYMNEDSTKPNKVSDDAYNERMLKKIGVNPRIYSKEFAIELIIEQSPDDIDGVAGASASTKEVQIMSKVLFDKAKSGDTKTDVISIH